MKWLITGDLHFNDKRRDRYRHEFVTQLQEIAQTHRVERIIVLGDLTEEKDRHAAWLVNKVVEHFKRLTRIAPVTILRANHDYRDISNPFFEFLGKFENIKWIGKPDPGHLPGVLFLPHTRDYARDWAKVDFRKCQWVFTHNTFDGARNENGMTLRGIPLFAIPRGVVISGDVHVPQTTDLLTYVGAPYLINFGDSFKPRVLLIDKGKVVSIPCTGPQKRLVEITWPSLGADERILEEALKRVKPRDLVKMRVILQPAQYDKWDNIYDTVMKWAERKRIEMCGVTPDVLGGNTSTLESTKAQQRKWNDADLMKEYVRRQNADERTLKTGRILLEGK